MTKRPEANASVASVLLFLACFLFGFPLPLLHLLFFVVVSKMPKLLGFGTGEAAPTPLASYLISPAILIKPKVLGPAVISFNSLCFLVAR